MASGDVKALAQALAMQPSLDELPTLNGAAALPKTGYFRFTWASSVQSYTTGLLRLVNPAQLGQIIAADTPKSDAPTTPAPGPQVGVAVPEIGTPPAPRATKTEPASEAPEPKPAPDTQPAPVPAPAPDPVPTPAETPSAAPPPSIAPAPAPKRVVQIIPGEEVDQSAAVAQQPSTGHAPQAPGSAPRPETQATAATTADAPASSSPSAKPGSKPSTPPVAPVTSGDQLTKDNAGSVSGGRQGDEVTLYLPSDAAQPKEWVSVFTYPGAQGSDWLEVSNERSVVINIASMKTGSYKLAVANSSGKLIGWAQLEISEENQGDDKNAIAPAVGSADSDSGMGGGDWLLLGAAGVLVAGAVGFIFLTRPRTVSGI